MGLGVKERTLEFLSNYGDKGYVVLKAAVECALSTRKGEVRLGDFNYRGIVQRLRLMGIEYNPSMILRILERDYGIIETTYRSQNQHWWKFLSIDDVIEALREYEEGIIVGEEDYNDIDPEVEVLRIQIAALAPQELEEKLRRLASKPILSRYERKVFEQIAFKYLTKVGMLLKKAMRYQDELQEEIAQLVRVLKLAAKIANKLSISYKQASRVLEGVAKLGSGEKVLKF